MKRAPRPPPAFGRRDVLRGLGLLAASCGGRVALRPPEPATGLSPASPEPASRTMSLVIAETPFVVEGERGLATAINGTVPGPLLRFREGDDVTIHVRNDLDEDTSVHWHGLLLPNGMDGVPGVNFPGIPPGETFTYRFPIKQYGTYWYHSHSGLQEQTGHYGPLILDPARGEPLPFDREHVIVLSDWTFENPYEVLENLKKDAGYYNFGKRTAADFFSDMFSAKPRQTLGQWIEWGGMRMNPTDISDVTGATYTYLMNGMGPLANFTALFRPGERVRLRIINAGAATYFDFRIPGLPMTVIQASGQHVEPVGTDEIRIAIAETYDVILEPQDRPYTMFAEAMDRSGYTRGTLAPRPGLQAPLPERRQRPLLRMVDMGMMHMEGEDHAGMGHGDMPMPAHAGHGEGHAALRPPGTLPEPLPHGPHDHGAANAAVPMVTYSRLDEPGVGLEEVDHRVLVYTQLRSLEPRLPLPPPEREIELHLTGNMERFMWSIDGKTLAESKPIPLRLGERVRLTLVNDTMMQHPMHLHGMWMELENGAVEAIPRVHTVNVKPAERLSLLVTADAPGPWAFHCHVLYHMELGMMRVFEVVP